MHVTSLALLVAALPLALGAPAEKRQETDGDSCVIEYVPRGEPASADTNDSGEAPAPAVDGAASDTVAAQFSASTTFTFENGLPAGLIATNGETITAGGPIASHFEASNVEFEDGFMVLKVRGGGNQANGVSAAQVKTDFSVFYGSVRTRAILTEESGVCNGMFLYRHSPPSQEADIEFISNPNAQQNADANNGTRAMLYTIWHDPASDDRESSVLYGASPDNATSTVHEYRLDWFEDRVDWYLDGDFQHSNSDPFYVPFDSGPWLWNNWNNGDPAWTTDPPVNDAPFKIERIEMYYNPA